MIFINQSQTS